MIKKTAGFSFTVPEGHPDEGTKIEKTFTHDVCETEEEATKVLTDKKWKVLEMVNDMLKANARSSAYQAALLPYRPSEVPPEDIKERMVRDYIRLGISEEIARATVESVLGATK